MPRYDLNLGELVMNTRKSATIVSFTLVIVMILGAVVQSAYADMVVGNTAEATSVAAPTGKIGAPLKVKPCNARCLKGKMEAIASIMAKATSAKSGGLTRLTCKQVQERVNEVAATIPKDVTIRFDRAPDDFPCWGIYIGPRR